MRVVTLNLNGIRSAIAKGFLEWLEAERPEVACLQETRIHEAGIDPGWARAVGMEARWDCAGRPGYSGVAVWSRRPPDRVRRGLGWAAGDAEGRLLRADFGRTRVVSLYMPSGSSSELRQSFKYRYMEHLADWLERQRRARRHVLVCGDWNIAHRRIDLRNWRGNQDRSGFLPQERAWMDARLDGQGWVDVYRRLHPDHQGEAYTWWSNRGRAWQNNVGWRIDYEVATPGLARRAVAASVYRARRFSDHAPLTIEFDHAL